MNSEIGKNIWYASLGSMIPAVFTSIFWFAAAKLAGSDIIGTASAIASFVTIIATIDVFNTSLGMKRYLGIAYASQDYGKFRQILISASVIALIFVAVTMTLVSIPDIHLLELVGIGREYTWVIVAMIPALAYQQIFSEALVTVMKARDTIIPLIIGSVARFPVLLVMIYVFSMAEEGTVIGYALVIFISAILYFISAIKIFQGKNTTLSSEGIMNNVKLVFRASLAGWIPRLLGIIGSQLGVLAVFSAAGAAEGGKFYIPLSIFSVALFLVSGINRVSQSVVAGMSSIDDQINHMLYTVKLAFMFTIPIAFPLIFFAGDYLKLLGADFTTGSSTLAILMAGLPLAIISEIVYYFVYGRGDHRSLMYLGIAGNLPRAILYFVFAPTLGATGAAIAYLMGSIFQATMSIQIGRKHQANFDYRNYIMATLVPLLIGFLCWYIGLQYVVSTTIIFLGSYLAYTRIHLFTKTELRSVIYAGLPRKSAEKVYPLLAKMVDVIS